MFEDVTYEFVGDVSTIRFCFRSELHHYPRNVVRPAIICDMTVFFDDGSILVVENSVAECGKKDVYNPVFGMRVSLGKALKEAKLEKEERNNFLDQFGKMVGNFQYELKALKKKLDEVEEAREYLSHLIF